MKKQLSLFILLTAIIIHANTFAQFNIKKQRTVGGSQSDALYSIFPTKDGGFIAGGASLSNKSFEKTDSSRGHDDYWVVKLDSLGNIQWDKTIGGDNPDILRCIRQTKDGGYILGGSSSSNISGEKTENSFYLEDYWVVKLDRDGNIQWDKTVGGASMDNLYTVEQTSDGGYILGGDSFSDISRDKTEKSRGASDYWIVKLDCNGAIQWDKTIGARGYEDFKNLFLTIDGGFILGGQSPSNTYGEKSENSRGRIDYWIVKLDKNGIIEWDKTIGGNSEDFFEVVRQTHDGGYILGGSSVSGISGEKSQKNHTAWAQDFWIVKTDNKGNVEWDKTIGSDYYDYFASIEQTCDSGFILGGSSSGSISGEKTENSKGYNDFWIIKLNKQHNIEWDKTIGGDKDDAVKEIKEMSKNKYFLAGSSNSGISGDKTQKSRGANGLSDYWFVILTYDIQNNITSNESSDLTLKENIYSKKFNIYPNPVQSELFVRVEGKSIITLTDQTGRTLLTKTINGYDIIDVSNFSAGVYYLNNNSTKQVRKLFITK